MNECLAFCWHEIQMNLNITDQIKGCATGLGAFLVSALQIAKEEKLPASHAWENGLPHFWSLPRVTGFLKCTTNFLILQAEIEGKSIAEGGNLGSAVAVHITTAWWHLKEGGKKEGKENVLSWKKIPHFAILGLRYWIHVHVVVSLKRILGAWTHFEHTTLAFVQDISHSILDMTSYCWETTTLDWDTGVRNAILLSKQNWSYKSVKMFAFLIDSAE